MPGSPRTVWRVLAKEEGDCVDIDDAKILEETRTSSEDSEDDEASCCPARTASERFQVPVAKLKEVIHSRNTWFYNFETVISHNLRMRQSYQIDYVDRRISEQIEIFQRSLATHTLSPWTALEQLWLIRRRFLADYFFKEEDEDHFLSEVLHALEHEVNLFLADFGPLSTDGAAMPTDPAHEEAVGDFLEHLARVADDVWNDVESLRRSAGMARGLKKQEQKNEQTAEKKKDMLSRIYLEKPYPSWFKRSALCKAMQLELCDLAKTGAYQCLKETLKVIKRTHEKYRTKGWNTSSLFWWTELPVVLFRRYWQGMPDGGHRAAWALNDSSAEFLDRIDKVWIERLPKCMCELSNLKGVLDGQLHLAKRFKLGALATGVLGSAVPLLQSHWPEIMVWYLNKQVNTTVARLEGSE